MSYSAGAARMAAAALLACASGSALAAPIPIDDLSRLPNISGVSLTPDGEHLVALISTGEDAERPALSVWKLDNPELPPVITQSSGEAEFVTAWAMKAGKVAAIARNPYSGETYGCVEGTTGPTRTYLFKFFLTDLDLKSFSDPFSLPGILRGRGEATKRCLEIAVRGQVREDLLTLDPENVVIAEFDIASFRTDYSKFNLRSGRTEFLFTDQSSDSAGLIDPRDASVWTRIRVESRSGGYAWETRVRDAKSGQLSVHDKLTWTSADRHTIAVVGRDEASGKFYVVTDQFSDHTQVFFYDPVAREYESEALFALENFSATGVVLGENPSDFNQLLGFRYQAAAPAIYWIDPELAAIQNSLEDIFTDGRVSIIDFSDDRSRILFTVGDSNRPDRYYVLDDRKAVRLIGDSMPWIDVKDTSRTRLVTYTARDGMKIPALLTPPTGWRAGQKPGPAVVIPHGGPWARDFAEWDGSGWVQYFASRGFTVLQPQFRGSDGFGRALWLAGDAQWGLKMQDDKDDGARWLIEQGYAEPGKLIIMGYSYGGFAAFAAAVREGGPFKCAIAGAGVSDVKRLSRTWSDDRRQRFLQGVTVRGMNPIENAGKATMPMLIFHGDRDVRVPLSHSRSFFNRVKDRAPATLVEIPDMPHQFPWRPDWKRTALRAVDDFLSGPCQL